MFSILRFVNRMIIHRPRGAVWYQLAGNCVSATDQLTIRSLGKGVPDALGKGLSDALGVELLYRSELGWSLRNVFDADCKHSLKVSDG